MRKKRILILALVLALLLLIPVGITFSRYVTKNIKNYLMEADNFFFNSDKLSDDGMLYEINNWGGVSNIPIQFELNNHKNNILTSASDIDYNITITHSEGVVTTLDSASGTIFKSEKTDNFAFEVVPLEAFNDNDSIWVNVKATSSSPYIKELSARYVITVGRRGIDYEITDSTYSPYLLFRITNAKEVYKVYQAFDGYDVGHEFTSNEYKELTSAQKAKCASAMVTLTFNPADVVIDTTSEVLAFANSLRTTTVSGVAYISEITFPVDILSSTEVRFYKNDTSLNYTYPSEGISSPIISFAAS